MRNVVAALVLACVAFGGFALGGTASVEEALSAYRKSQIAEAKADFAAIVADNAASTRDRVVARRELAHIAWLIDADPAAARAHLESADARTDETCYTPIHTQSHHPGPCAEIGKPIFVPCYFPRCLRRAWEFPAPRREIPRHFAKHRCFSATASRVCVLEFAGPSHATMLPL